MTPTYKEPTRPAKKTPKQKKNGSPLRQGGSKGVAWGLQAVGVLFSATEQSRKALNLRERVNFKFSQVGACGGTVNSQQMARGVGCGGVGGGNTCEQMCLMKF